VVSELKRTLQILLSALAIIKPFHEYKQQPATFQRLHNNNVPFSVIASNQNSRGAMLARAGRPEFDSRQAQEIFLYSTVSRPALGPIHPPTQRGPGVKRPGHEPDQ
jgi:hypothetical protein